MGIFSTLGCCKGTSEISNLGVYYEQINQLSKMQAKVEDFEKVKLLGKGAYANVFLVKNTKIPTLYFAMKVIHKARLKNQKQMNNIKSERRILQSIGNYPFLAHLRFAFQDNESLYFITDFAQGGELFYHLKQEKVFCEDKAKFYCAEIIFALNFLHSKNIIYRDLKPENVLIDNKGHIILTDFGLSKDVGNELAMTKCGTIEYLAPEVIEAKGYDYAVDYWSLGCLLYEMLTGKQAYPSKKMDMSRFDINPDVFNHLTREACNFIFMFLLNKDVKIRTSKKLSDHKFFRNVNFQKILNKSMTPPFVPELSSPEDLRYFDTSFTSIDVNNDIIEVPLSFKDNLRQSEHEIKSEIDKEIDNENTNDFANFSFVNGNISPDDKLFFE